jgi:hypothetical protein
MPAGALARFSRRRSPGEPGGGRQQDAIQEEVAIILDPSSSPSSGAEWEGGRVGQVQSLTRKHRWKLNVER